MAKTYLCIILNFAQLSLIIYSVNYLANTFTPNTRNAILKIDFYFLFLMIIVESVIKLEVNDTLKKSYFFLKYTTKNQNQTYEYWYISI